MSQPFIGPTMEVATVRPGEGRPGGRGRSSLMTPGMKVGGDFILSNLARGSALLVMLMLAALIAVLAHASLPSIRTFGAAFLASSDWRPNPLEVPKHDKAGNVVIDEDGNTATETIPPAFGALPVIFGTAVSSVLALVFAVPLSLGAALFLVRIAPRLKVPIGRARIHFAEPVSFLIEFLAAIPSIAYGMWGLFVLAPFLQKYVEHWLGSAYIAMGKPAALHWLFQDKMVLANGSVLVRDISLTGRDMFCGGLVLAIMIIPIVTAIARDVLKSVPRAQIEGTTALGATWWQSSKEMLRYSRAGLFGAVMLGLARAAGETMAVTMIIGNNNQIRASLFAPAQTMSSLLANEFAEASTDLHRAALSEVALILLVMSLAFNIIARYLVVGKGSRSAAAH
ncbi:MAG TPA: phosphate ABC transporter permease subunit PstC [Tepidisphaeraceae bacterium]|nr:phosphate ABC transporter permease subunit PstC [Tepidisphaeraceae bacterium]